MRQSQAEALQVALVECQRFVKAAKLSLETKQADDFDKHARDGGDSNLLPRYNFHPRNKETSATKRASMDLTRALARFRRA